MYKKPKANREFSRLQGQVMSPLLRIACSEPHMYLLPPALTKKLLQGWRGEMRGVGDSKLNGNASFLSLKLYQYRSKKTQNKTKFPEMDRALWSEYSWTTYFFFRAPIWKKASSDSYPCSQNHFYIFFQTVLQVIHKKILGLGNALYNHRLQYLCSQDASQIRWQCLIFA